MHRAAGAGEELQEGNDIARAKAEGGCDQAHILEDGDCEHVTDGGGDQPRWEREGDFANARCIIWNPFPPIECSQSGSGHGGRIAFLQLWPPQSRRMAEEVHAVAQGHGASTPRSRSSL